MISAPLKRFAITAFVLLVPLPSWADPQAVKVMPIEYDYVNYVVSTFGILAPQVEEISFPIAGRIEQFHVEEGDRVEAGQLLVELEEEDAREALSQAQSALNTAQRILDRMTTLHARGSIQESQLEDAKDQFYEAEISYKAAQLDLERCYLKSKSAGTILKHRIRSRTSVQPGESIFVFLSDDEPWVTRVELTDRAALMMSSEAEARVYFAPFPAEVFAGRVTRMAKVANPEDGLYTAEITINPGGFTLLPGMVAEIELNKRSEQRYFIVPLDAVLDLKDKKGIIYLVSADGAAAVEKPVTISSVHDEFVALVEDLGEFEFVITHGHHGLSDQAMISIYD